MSADRAKQFMPFDSLKGFRQNIQTKEKIIIPKKQLSEDMIENINASLTLIHPGDIVEITFYKNQAYHTYKGKIIEINTTHNFVILDHLRIYFSDLYEINL